MNLEIIGTAALAGGAACIGSWKVKALLSQLAQPDRRIVTSRGPPFARQLAANPCSRCGGTGRTRCGSCHGTGTPSRST